MWPGEPVAKVLEDLQSAWRWGRVPNLLTAMELVMWTLMLQRPDKVGICVAFCNSILNNLCICSFLGHASWFALAGHYTAAVASVETEDSEDWFVNQ